MGLRVNVKDGTNAGFKQLSAPFPHDWKCTKCGHYNKSVWRNCYTCVAPRPNYH